ncbi:DUF4276 family protein [Sphingomicrobium flavum]|uniref:DUF4276 family protein n=1 Tax=Sphingomicrobium flavum TaxID=1229164 RepID=UPI0021ADE28A|nr:DUF4276 family protein [Sphingomicrobium flavum]
MRFVSIVEGYGDESAVPCLIAKAAAHVGHDAFPLRPIRAGEWKKLTNAGELERYLELALSREPDKIFVVLDLDDGCCVNESATASARIDAWRNGREIDVSLVFIEREYESLFLASLDVLSAGQLPPHPDPCMPRDAKFPLKAALGQRYKETQDQVLLTQRLDIELLYQRHRPFRKLMKDITGIDYDTLGQLL